MDLYCEIGRVSGATIGAVNRYIKYQFPGWHKDGTRQAAAVEDGTGEDSTSG
jgi:hypothetical protein